MKYKVIFRINKKETWSLSLRNISATASRSPEAAYAATASEHRRLVVGYKLLLLLDPGDLSPTDFSNRVKSMFFGVHRKISIPRKPVFFCISWHNIRHLSEICEVVIQKYIWLCCNLSESTNLYNLILIRHNNKSKLK